MKKLLVDSRDYDSIVIGSGPNGLAAAITMQQAGLSVLLVEARDTIGGGLRSGELTLPHFLHDICSAIHTLGASSPFFRTLPLEQYGLKFIQPPISVAHPFDDGTASALYPSLEKTAEALGNDGQAYLKLIKPLVKKWPDIVTNVLGPLGFPRHPIAMLEFGWKAIKPGSRNARLFRSKEARGLWAGMCAHSMQPLDRATTSAIALVLMITGHKSGWPVAEGGSAAIAKALGDYFVSTGGTIETNFPVRSLTQLPSSKALLFDLDPRQLLNIAGHKFSGFYKKQLNRYRYGPGVFKIDWALNGPIPFKAPECRQAGTIHLGNSFEEIATCEKLVSEGKHPERPFVILAQQSLFDPSRTPQGKHTAWAYCHVPNGSTVDMTERIERQVERFAPGFKLQVLAKYAMNAVQLEEYNPCYIGGDIAGGMMNARQLFFRPALRISPYRTSAKGIYICSASTPPGGGVHGMCGYYAAKKALSDIFHKRAIDLY